MGVSQLVASGNANRGTATGSSCPGQKETAAALALRRQSDRVDEQGVASGLKDRRGNAEIFTEYADVIAIQLSLSIEDLGDRRHGNLDFGSQS
jgi:hypothetical protein